MGARNDNPRMLKMRRLEQGGGPRVMKVRAVNPEPPRLRPGGRPRRRTGLKRMVGLGSQVLDRLLRDPRHANDPQLSARIQTAWDDLAVAWNSTRADRRVALTRLQEELRAWTAEDADIAQDRAIQHYRKQLHLTLDH